MEKRTLQNCQIVHSNTKGKLSISLKLSWRVAWRLICFSSVRKVPEIIRISRQFAIMWPRQGLLRSCDVGHIFAQSLPPESHLSSAIAGDAMLPKLPVIHLTNKLDSEEFFFAINTILHKFFRKQRNYGHLSSLVCWNKCHQNLC